MSTLTYTVDSLPANGTLTYSNTGSFRFTPTPDFV